jgi:DNA-binding transcriptional MerR regulator
LDGPAVARALGVTPELIRQWAHRGLLTRHGTDAHRRARYDLAEAFQVQARMRRRQSRASGPSGPATTARPATGSGPAAR